jgi:hypothetical protein
VNLNSLSLALSLSMQVDLPRVKVAEDHEADHLPLSDVIGRNAWSFAYMPSVCFHSIVLKHMDVFTCNLPNNTK